MRINSKSRRADWNPIASIITWNVNSLNMSETDRVKSACCKKYTSWMEKSISHKYSLEESKENNQQKNGLYRMREGSNHQEQVAILNVSLPSKRTAKFVKHKLTVLNTKTEKFTMIVEEVHCPSSTIYTTIRQKN